MISGLWAGGVYGADTQELGVTLEIIDRCQNHLLGGSKVRRHYLHHDYAIEKTEAWKALGERVEIILAPSCEWEGVQLLKGH